MENEPLDVEILVRITESIKIKDTEFKRRLYNVIVLRLKLMDTKFRNLKPLYYLAMFIIRSVGEFYCLPENYHEDKTRKREYVRARYVAMCLIAKNTKLARGLIGAIFAGKDHAMVNHAIRTIRNHRDVYEKFNIEFISLAEKLGLIY